MLEISVTNNLPSKEIVLFPKHWMNEVCSLPSHSMAEQFCSYLIHFVSSVPFLFFSPIHLCSLLLLKNSFIVLYSSLKCSLLQNHFKIHSTYLQLLEVILSHFLSFSFEVTSGDFPYDWSPFNTICTRSNLGKLQKNSGNDSISVRECLCWSSVEAICGYYWYPFLSFPWHWKN